MEMKEKLYPTLSNERNIPSAPNIEESDDEATHID